MRRVFASISSSVATVNLSVFSRRSSYTPIFGGDHNLMGTNSSFTSQFIEELKTDLLEQDPTDGSMTCLATALKNSAIRKGELDHMESPETDKRTEQKIDNLAANLFKNIPEPEDPMKAALAPTAEEVAAVDKLEVLREAVRQRYWSNKSRRQMESDRIDEAMSAIEKGKHPIQSSTDERKSMSDFVTPKFNPDEEKAALKKRILEMQAQLAALEGSEE